MIKNMEKRYNPVKIIKINEKSRKATIFNENVLFKSKLIFSHTILSK